MSQRTEDIEKSIVAYVASAKTWVEELVFLDPVSKAKASSWFNELPEIAKSNTDKGKDYLTSFNNELREVGAKLTSHTGQFLEKTKLTTSDIYKYVSTKSEEIAFGFKQRKNTAKK
jgi:hypothetical protein